MVKEKQRVTGRKRGILGLAVLALSAGATVLTSASPAQAADPQCHTRLYTYHGGGFCSGSGTSPHYVGGVQCTDGRWYYGPLRDMGDERGSYGYCPSGSYANRAMATSV